MITRPATPTTTAALVVDLEPRTVARVLFATPAWCALLEWLTFHDIDASQIPAGSPITRDAVDRCVRYLRVRELANGKADLAWVDGFPQFQTDPVVEQGEGPPLPFPDPIAVLLRPVPVNAQEATA